MRIDLSRLVHAFGLDGEPAREVDGGDAQGVAIGMTDEGDAVRWPSPSIERASHAVCLAGSGTGKSTLLAVLLAEEVRSGLRLPQGQRPSYFVLIPKSDFRQAIEQALAALVPDALAQLVVLNPFAPRPFAFNLNRLWLGGTPLEIRAWQLGTLVAEVSTSVGLLRSGGASAGARQIDVLTHLLLGALTVPDPRASVLLAYDAVVTPQGLERLASISTSERARGFLMSTKLGDELAAGVAARLRLAFAASSTLERMLAAEDAVQFEELTAPGRICLVDLGEPFGGMPALQSFWAGLFVALAIDHALTRPAPFATGHHLRIVVDEVQTVAAVLAARSESLLATGRARNLSLTVAGQSAVAINRAAEGVLAGLLANAALRIVGRLSAEDADLMAKQIAPLPGSSERPKFLRERFQAAVCNLPDRQWFLLEPGQRQRFTSRPIDGVAWETAHQRAGRELQAAAEHAAVRLDGPPRASLAELTPAFIERSRARRPPVSPTVSSAPTGNLSAAATSRWG